MADPISILGLIGTVGPLLSQLQKTLRSIRDAPAEITDCLKELDELGLIVPIIRDYNEKAAASTLRSTDATIQPVLEITLRACEKEISALIAIVERYHQGLHASTLTKVASRLNWTFQLGAIGKSKTRLQSMKLTLSLALSACGRHNDSIILDGLSSVQETVNAASSARGSEYGDIKSELGRLMLLMEQAISEALTESGRYNIESSSHIDRLSKNLPTSIEAKSSAVQSNTTAIELSGSVDSLSHSKRHTGSLRPLSYSTPFSNKNSRASTIADSSPYGLATGVEEHPLEDKNSEKTLDSVLSLSATKYKEQELNIDWDRFAMAWKQMITYSSRKEERWSDDKIREYCQIVLTKRTESSLVARSKLDILVRCTLRLGRFPQSLKPAMSRLLDDNYEAHEKGISKVLQAAKMYRSGQDKISEAIIRCSEAHDADPTGVPSKTVEQLWGTISDYSEALAPFVEFMVFVQQKPDRWFPKWLHTHVYACGLDHEWETLKEYDRKLDAASTRMREEAEYAHRREMSRTASDVKEIGVTQQKILNAIEDQRKILEALREERALLSIVQDQQKILQALQRIQMRLPA